MLQHLSGVRGGVYVASLTSILGLFGCQSTSQNSNIASHAIHSVPAVVVLPGGEYYQGDQTNLGDSDERPVQPVLVSSFALSLSEITFTQFDEFAKQTQRALPPDEGWGRGDRPVINVNWQDAQDYVNWLKENTGESWRLPTESEWEYAARAGKYTQYQSGNDPVSVCRAGNIADKAARSSGNDWQITQCQDNVTYTAEVKQYRPNNFGLYDMHGNVWEWVQDCYAPYVDHPRQSDNASQTQSQVACQKRVIRGGSYLTPAQSSRVSNREALEAEVRLNQVGFRVVKDL